MKKQLSFARHVHNTLVPYRFGVALAVCLLVATAFASVTVSMKARSDQRLLAALSPYLATLIESQDRPEILRVLHAATANSEAKFTISMNGAVFASTGQVSEMDQPFGKPTSLISLFGSSFSAYEIISARKIGRDSGPALSAEIYCFYPLAPTLYGAGLVALLTFGLGILISYLSSRRMEGAVRGALAPLSQLQRDIAGLALESDTPSLAIEINEAEDIRETIFKVKTDLAETRERLAEGLARKLSAESFKRLIHDLHNPVAALRQWLEIWTDPETAISSREKAATIVPEIADQILRQIGSARKNLESDPNALRESDLRQCLVESVQQVQGGSKFLGQKKLDFAFPASPVVVAHDPDLVKRAVVNLLENGIEASRSCVSLTLEQVGRQVFVRVADDGRGMQEDDVPVFFQGRGRSSKGGREALGLSSANHIIRTHGGRLVYSKNQLGGATFEIKLEATS